VPRADADPTSGVSLESRNAVNLMGVGFSTSKSAVANVTLRLDRGWLNCTRRVLLLTEFAYRKFRENLDSLQPVEAAFWTEKLVSAVELNRAVTPAAVCSNGVL
jgi:hypothetical protein